MSDEKYEVTVGDATGPLKALHDDLRVHSLYYLRNNPAQAAIFAVMLDDGTVVCATASKNAATQEEVITLAEAIREGAKHLAQ